MCDQQHDEEMLLMTPVEGTVTAVDDGECEFELENAGATSCRPNEEVLKQLNKSMTMIVVECEKVISQSFRTTDPVRNKIREMVERQVKVAKETIKTTLEQTVAHQKIRTATKSVQTLEKRDIDEEVVEMLKIANLTQAAQLEKCLDEKLADQEVLRELCEVTGCEKNELEVKLREMKERIAEKEHDIAELREYIEQQEIQIRELTEQMREMGHGKSQATSSSGGYGQDAVSLAQWDPHMLIAIANRMLKEKNGKPMVFCGHSGLFSTPQERNGRAPGLRTREAMTETRNPRLPEGRVAVQCYSCGKVGHLAKDCRNPGQQKVNETERHQRSSDVRQGRSFSTRVDLAGKVPGGGDLETSGKLFGPKSVRIARMLGMNVEVLLDTGSEMSIMPVQVLQRAREQGTDLDTYVTKIPRINAVVRNASGEIMEFVDAICVDVVLGGERQLVPFHVGNCVDELVILGTNALELFGIALAPKEMEETADSGKMEKTRAVIKGSVFIPAHSVKVHGACKVTGDGTAAITVWNTADEARVLHKGEVVGEWTQEEWTPASAFDNGADLLEKGSEHVVQDEKKSALRMTYQARSEGRNQLLRKMSELGNTYADSPSQVLKLLNWKGSALV
ncbi:unnamed protein product [Nippostrongylus brasiliensis]|uniref:CCHC-type domain-containing protein n=2 Tax=Nippostrongylus brasiliensis TaxID=27835 RepID=A0A0N4XYM9_NIPBR|nr:unnamed protein product [Nippostrongylus brasiliensis]